MHSELQSEKAVFRCLYCEYLHKKYPNSCCVVLESRSALNQGMRELGWVASRLDPAEALVMVRSPVPTDTSPSGRFAAADSVLHVRMLKKGHGRVKQALTMGMLSSLFLYLRFLLLRLKFLPYFAVVRIGITGFF